MCRSHVFVLRLKLSIQISVSIHWKYSVESTKFLDTRANTYFSWPSNSFFQQNFFAPTKKLLDQQKNVFAHVQTDLIDSVTCFSVY